MLTNDLLGPLNPGVPLRADDLNHIVGDGGWLAVDIGGMGGHLTRPTERFEVVPDVVVPDTMAVMLAQDAVPDQTGRVGWPPCFEHREDTSWRSVGIARR